MDPLLHRFCCTSDAQTLAPCAPCQKTYCGANGASGLIKAFDEPHWTGSLPVKKTIGIVLVACFAAKGAETAPSATITLCRKTEHWELECSHTDAGDPWCVIHDRQEHRIVLHIARIDRRYVVVCPTRQQSVATPTIDRAIDMALAELVSMT